MQVTSLSPDHRGALNSFTNDTLNKGNTTMMNNFLSNKQMFQEPIPEYKDMNTVKLYNNKLSKNGAMSPRMQKSRNSHTYGTQQPVAAHNRFKSQSMTSHHDQLQSANQNARDYLMTPTDGQSRGSVNMKEYQKKLHSVRQKLKSQNGSRFSRGFQDTNFTGGYQAGFFSTSGLDKMIKSQNSQMIQTMKHQLNGSVGPTLAETQSNDMLSLNVRGSKLSAKSVRHNIPVGDML